MSKCNSQFQFDTIDLAWVIRAGVSGSADTYFMNDNVIVLQDQGVGDLAQIEPTRQAFYKAYSSTKPDETRTSIAGIGGKFYRFVHEMQIGGIVLYPSLRLHEIYCGEITSEYLYVINNLEYPHQRKVQWITSFPKSILSKAAQYELGAARTLFRYKRNLDEVIDKLKSAQPIALR